jgi:hypothetical protein
VKKELQIPNVLCPSMGEKGLIQVSNGVMQIITPPTVILLEAKQ